MTNGKGPRVARSRTSGRRRPQPARRRPARRPRLEERRELQTLSRRLGSRFSRLSPLKQEIALQRLELHAFPRAQTGLSRAASVYNSSRKRSRQQAVNAARGLSKPHTASNVKAKEELHDRHGGLATGNVDGRMDTEHATAAIVLGNSLPHSHKPPIVAGNGLTTVPHFYYTGRANHTLALPDGFCMVIAPMSSGNGTASTDGSAFWAPIAYYTAAVSTNISAAVPTGFLQPDRQPWTVGPYMSPINGINYPIIPLSNMVQIKQDRTILTQNFAKVRAITPAICGCALRTTATQNVQNWYEADIYFACASYNLAASTIGSTMGGIGGSFAPWTRDQHMIIQDRVHVSTSMNDQIPVALYGTNVVSWSAFKSLGTPFIEIYNDTGSQINIDITATLAAALPINPAAMFDNPEQAIQPVQVQLNHSDLAHMGMAGTGESVQHATARALEAKAGSDHLLSEPHNTTLKHVAQCVVDGDINDAKISVPHRTISIKAMHQDAKDVLQGKKPNQFKKKKSSIFSGLIREGVSWGGQRVKAYAKKEFNRLGHFALKEVEHGAEYAMSHPEMLAKALMSIL